MMRYTLMLAAVISANSYAIEKISTDSDTGFKLSAKELAVAKKLFDDEKKIFLQGGDVAFVDGPTISATAKEVAALYDENQIAGDQKYFKKTVRITGVIHSINSGLNNSPSVSLVGKGFIQNPQVHFSSPDIPRIAKLKKGQNISFVCNGAGVLVGTPVFNSCVFSDEYAEKRIEIMTESIGLFLKNKQTESDEAQLLTILIVTLARVIPDQSACFTGKGSCLQELKKSMGKNFEKYMKETVENLMSLGFKFKKTEDKGAQ